MASVHKEHPKLPDFVKALKGVESVTWCQLDPYLDGEPRSFERDVKRLVRGLERYNVRVESVSPTNACEAGCYDDPYIQQGSLRSDGVQPYEKELMRMPRLNRVGEFRMARRYEFLRARAAVNLEAAGFEPDRIRQLLLHADREDVEWPAENDADPKIRERVKQRLTEFDDLRNTFVEATLYIVMSAVHKYRNLGIDTLDLIQEGNISLFQAVEGFDWRRAVRFKTYAEYWVNQAFLKMLYNNVRTVRVPVWVQKTLKKIKDLQTEAMHKRGEKLSNEQIGEQLDMPASKVESLLKTQRYSVSLDQELGSEEDAGKMSDMLEDSRSVPVPDQIEDVNLSERLKEVMKDLPERERLILKLRFGLDGKTPQTLFEIGEMLKVSAERVRQLQEAALRRLKLPKSKQLLRPFATV